MSSPSDEVLSLGAQPHDAPIIDAGEQEELGAAGSSSGRYTRNVFIVGLSIFVSAASGLLLPSYLTHRLSPAVYGGWLLILQVSGYVGILDFGMQTAIAKYIAQGSAARDEAEVNAYASAGTAIMVVGGAIGLVLSIVLALLVPVLFRDMPTAIAHEVAKGVLLVGISAAFLLACSSFAAFFRGLQSFKIPTLSVVLNKLFAVAVLIVLVSQHSSLHAMAWSAAIVNVLTGLGQVLAWKKLLASIQVRLSLVRTAIMKQMLTYCAVLGIWTSGILIIMGLDLTIVGHYDFRQTAFYAIAATPTTFLLLLLQAALNPLMPAVSALSVHRSAEAMGDLLARSTRYITLLLELAGLPLILFGYLILTLWVGPAYAQRSLPLMRLLLLAQMIRNLCAPYATVVIATGTHREATFSTLCEAAVNLGFSLLLGRWFGAIGVATGTLIGAIVGVLVHFTVSMRRTQGAFRISAQELFRDGILRPGVAVLPTLLLLPWFWHAVPTPHTLVVAGFWSIATLALSWYIGLNSQERAGLASKARRFVHAGA